MKRRSRSLRSVLTTMMAILVALQSIALVVALLVSRVFTTLDAESFRLFDNTASARAEEFNNDIGLLVSNTAVEAEYLTSELQKLARQYSTTPGELHQDDEAFDDAIGLIAERLLSLIQGNNVTGAFMFLEGSNFDKDSADTHSAIYIRNSAPNVTAGGYTNYMMELGPASIAQEYKITTSSRWTQDVQFDPASLPSLWTQPIWASEAYPYSELLRYGYWAAPQALFSDGRQVITYTLPVLDADGNAYGVMGFEISMQYFTQQFLNTSELPYQNSFYVVSPTEGTTLTLDWHIPGGTLAQVHMKNLDILALTESSQWTETIYEAFIDSLGAVYASVHDLQLYSANTPFDNVSWALVAFVSQTTLHETSSSVRIILIGSILATTAVALFAVVLLPLWATRKIRGLSKHVRGVTGHAAIAIPRTGLGEVDELIAAVEMLNRDVIGASQRLSKIMEMTDMPIGGFEVRDDVNDVFVTDYICELLGMPGGSSITQEEWSACYASLTAKPEPGDPDVYEYADRSGRHMWLRVVVNDSGGSRVGMVLDITQEIEEKRRLSHELDFDSLTGLYSRYAFKRVSYNLIVQRPDDIGAMVFADLDNLKYINDTYGHDSGDGYLKLAGEMFSRLLKQGAVVSRIAGDEFAIYLHGNGRSKEELREVLMGLMQDTESFILTTPDGKNHRLRFSAGIAWYPQDASNVPELLKMSDFAMYEAKHHRKGTIVEFDAKSYQENAFLLENTEAINRLLDEKLIHFDLQPLVDIPSGRVLGYEALMRSEMREFRSPLEILTVATAQNKLYQLEKLVMQKAFKLVQNYAGQLNGQLIFVNSLPSQQLNETDTAELMALYPDATKHMVIEITENERAPMEQMQEKVTALRALGCRIAIDDYGTGYSNELRILQLHPDYLKIDIAFIQGLATDEDKRQLVSSIVAFCKDRGIETVAEGLEDPEDLAEVLRQGIDYVQGFFTGPPAEGRQPVDPAAIRLMQDMVAYQ